MHHSIVFYNGAKVNYAYGMNGEKLKVVHRTANTTASSAIPGRPTSPNITSSTTEYIGGDIEVASESAYYGNTYNYFFGGGYCEFKPEVVNADSIQYFYYTKDHLGNIRNVLSKNASGTMEELQQTHYYPCGGIIANLSSGRTV